MHPITNKYRERFCSIMTAIREAERIDDKDEQFKLSIKMQELFSDFNSKYVVAHELTVT